eukprot:jgi/Tetstr1/447535/TSEL_034915.t2
MLNEVRHYYLKYWAESSGPFAPEVRFDRDSIFETDAMDALVASAQYGRAYGLARGRCRVISFRRARQRTMDRCRLQETALAARPVTRTLRLHPFSPLQSHRAPQAPQGHYHNQGH